jgi:hypothetical protein
MEKLEVQLYREQLKGCQEGIECCCNQILECDKVCDSLCSYSKYNIREKLAESLLKQGKYEAAKAGYNILIDMDCEFISKDTKPTYPITLKQLAKLKDQFNAVHDLMRKGIYPGVSADLSGGHSKYVTSMRVADNYLIIANICEKLGENYPARVCSQAAIEIRNYTPIGDKVIERRAERVQYLGDLFNEIKPD